jgi:hypothetical protein
MLCKERCVPKYYTSKRASPLCCCVSGFRGRPLYDGCVRQIHVQSVSTANLSVGSEIISQCHPSSDPVIEPMLQSVPDPFDSYGPPREEDQIFSILPPLSIMNPPSSADSPIATTPDHDPAPEMSSAGSSWEPIKGGCFPDTPTQWSDTPRSPRSISPPTAARRHSHPPSSGQRKSESKLKSVLSVIDESHSRQPSHEEIVHSEEPQSPPTANGTTVEPDYSWNGVGFEDTETRPVTEVDVPRNLDWPLPPTIPHGVPDVGRDHVDPLVEPQPLATISPC